MEYTIQKLAKISGVSTRTLRYYDEIGLLIPNRLSSNRYRIYSSNEVSKLQQILFYRELGMPLEEINQIMSDTNFNIKSALQFHLTSLLEKKEQLEQLIQNVSKTIVAMKGEIIMTDHEKFEGFKRKQVEENERKYGEEVREKYGNVEVDASNAKLLNMSVEQYNEYQALSELLNQRLKEAVLAKDPISSLAMEVCHLHQKWIQASWGSYSKEAHLGLCQMYTQDDRFKQYYEDICPGSADFLRKAMEVYLAEQEE